MLWERMLRAARLEPALYQEVERDVGATGQALLVVVMVAVLTGIGAGLRGGIWGLVGGVVIALAVWAVWSLVTFWVGTALFRGRATYGELLRCLGFAYTPSALGLFGFIALFGQLMVFIGSLWTLVAMVVAVREALDVTTGRAIAAALVGWVIIAVATALLSRLAFGPEMGAGMMGA